MSRTAVTRPHMRDFFVKGKALTVSVPGSPEWEVWIQKPTPLQFEDSNRKGRVAAARRRAGLLRGDSIEHEALTLEIEEMDLDTVVRELLGNKRGELERQAFNDVLFSDDYGSDWGKDGQKYIDLLGSVTQRSDELSTLASERGEQLRISDLLKDEEYKRLDDLVNRFQEEVRARYEELADAAEVNLKAGADVATLKREYLMARVEMEGQSEWFSEYKTWSAYYAVRDPDEHDLMYFATPDEFKNMPGVVQRQIIDCLETLEDDPDPKSLIPVSS